MHSEALDDPAYFLDTPVDEKTAQLVVKFLSHLNMKGEVDSLAFLITTLTSIHWLKTGIALQEMNPEYLETDLSEFPESTPILAVWSSSWYCNAIRYYAEGADSGTRFDDVFLINARLLEDACESDNPQWFYHMDYHSSNEVSGTFNEIGFPEEGYQCFIDRVLSFLDYSSYDAVDRDYYKQAHPIIRDYIEEQFSLYLVEEEE